MGDRKIEDLGGGISIVTETVQTPVGPKVVSALDCDDAWHGRPEGLTDEDMASFGLDEDADLNRLCDERKDGPFVRVAQEDL